MKIELTFIGGGQTIVDVDEWTVEKNLAGAIAKVRWVTGPTATRKLLYVNIEQLGSVVRIFDDVDDDMITRTMGPGVVPGVSSFE